jgi:cytidyltransferase-like protein
MTSFPFLPKNIKQKTMAFKQASLDNPGKKVMCFGSFDVFHKGHEYFLSTSQSYGDNLFIVVARDINIQKIKNFIPHYTETERQQEVQKAFSTASVILGDKDDFYIPLKKYQPHIICLGYDQKANIEKIKKHCPQVKIIRIAPYHPEKYKSSLLKQEQKNKK